MTIDLSKYKHTCSTDDAERFRMWLRERGGVALWGNLYLGDDATWSTPVLDKDGNPYKKPSWKATDQPVAIFTDPADIGVVTYKEVKRFRVDLRMGSQGMNLKLTNAANHRLNQALEKAGIGATYRFAYDTQEAVVLQPAAVVPLSEWTGTK